MKRCATLPPSSRQLRKVIRHAPEKVGPKIGSEREVVLIYPYKSSLWSCRKTNLHHSTLRIIFPSNPLCRSRCHCSGVLECAQQVAEAKEMGGRFSRAAEEATTDRTTVKKVSAVLKAAEEAPAPKAVEGKTVDEEGGESDETTKEAREMDSTAGRGVSPSRPGLWSSLS